MRPHRPLALCLALILVLAAAGCAGDGSTGLIASDGPGALDGELRVRRWSDARAWPTGRVPAAGDTVVVPAGTLMRLDVSPPALAGLDIRGVVEFDRDEDLTLTTGFIRNGGSGNAFALSTLNGAQNLTFIESNVLYIEPPVRTKDGDKAAVFQDLTGSVTGIAGRWVTANTPFLTTADCTLRGAWNAQICPGPYLRAVVEGSGTTTPIVPVDIVRDGGATERFVGSGTSTSLVIFAAMPVRRYAPSGRSRPRSPSGQQRLHVKVLVTSPSSSTQGSVTIRVRP